PKRNTTGSFLDSEYQKTIARKLCGFSDGLLLDRIIVPSLLANSNSLNGWIDGHQTIIRAFREETDLDLLATVALSRNLISSSEKVEDILEFAESIADVVSGYYVVLEPPRDQYLVVDLDWLESAFDLLAGLKMTGKQVIL